MNCLGWGHPGRGRRSTKLTGSLSNRSSISVCPSEEQSSHYSQSLPLFSFNSPCYHLPATPWKDHRQQEEKGVCKGRWQSWPLCLLLGVSSELGWGVGMENVLTYLTNPVKPWREVKFTPVKCVCRTENSVENSLASDWIAGNWLGLSRSGQRAPCECICRQR